MIDDIQSDHNTPGIHDVCDILLADGNKLPHFPSCIMGVLNVTPDSFSDGGRYNSTELAVKHGLEMMEQGARIIDVGGESTRPFSVPVSPEEEIKRVVPVISALKKEIERSELDTLLSIDSKKPIVVEKALRAGAAMINDIYALRAAGMAELAADHKVPVVIMHMQGTPDTMQQNPHYQDVIREISQFLEDRMNFAVEQGIKRERIILDPGIGFGKTTHHNLVIMNQLEEFTSLGQPILIGTSNKSFIGDTLNVSVEDRLEGTMATVAVSVWNRASIIRVHDVKSAKRVMDMTLAMRAPTGFPRKV